MKILELRGPLLAATLAVLAPGASLPAHAQLPPAGPIVFGDGRVAISGDVTATFSCAHAGGADGGSCADDPGFFNYTDYDHSLVRMLRLNMAAEVRATDQLSVLAEIRTEHGLPMRDGFQRVQPYAFFVRVRPWRTQRVDLQAGRVPPTFGAFARRSYASDNFLIGYPLAYQYLTSLRADALPATRDELLRMRGRGWLSNFSVGETEPAAGLPLINALQWDTGLQLHAAAGPVEMTGALTSGTLTNPRVADDNGGRQLALRVAVRPIAGLEAGVSAARGPYITRAASVSAGLAGATGRFTQTAVGADAEFSRGYYVVRFETILSEWRLPLAGEAGMELPLRALATSLEGRYKIRPGFYAAARFDHLGFSEVTGATRTAGWDAPVTRGEIGIGYALQRNLLLKASVQRNRRDGGRVRQLDITALQAVYWF